MNYTNPMTQQSVVFRWICVVLCAALSGCTTEAAIKSTLPVYDLLDQTKACCADLSDLGYSPLETTTRLKYQHDRRLKVIEINGVKAYARGFILPAQHSGDSLRLRTNMSTLKQSVARPGVLLLDDGYRVVSDVAYPDYHFDTGWTENDGFVATVPLFGANAKAKYVVVYTSAAMRGGAATACTAGYSGQVCPTAAVDPEGTVSLELLQ